MRQIKKTLIGLADLMRGRAAAPMWWTSAWRIDSPSATILCAGQHEGGRSYKALSIGFLALAFLVGCGDNEPSNSDIKKQLSNQVSPCPELSIVDFQKINGYPQNDGSYIDQVQYSLVYTPTDKILSYVSDYESKKSAIQSDGAVDTAKVQAATDQANSLGCMSSYQLALGNLSDSINDIPLLTGTNSLSDSDQTASSPAAATQLIDDDVTFITGYLQFSQRTLAADEASTQWPQQHIRDNYGNKAVMTQEEALDFDQKTVASYQDDLNMLSDMKAKFMNSVDQLSSCQGHSQEISQNNQGAYDHVQELKTEMVSANAEYLSDLQNDINAECHIVAVGGDSVLGLFSANEYDIEAYGKTYQITERESIHLVKSDNGWVIQN